MDTAIVVERTRLGDRTIKFVIPVLGDSPNPSGVGSAVIGSKTAFPGERIVAVAVTPSRVKIASLPFLVTSTWANVWYCSTQQH